MCILNDKTFRISDICCNKLDQKLILNKPIRLSAPGSSTELQNIRIPTCTNFRQHCIRIQNIELEYCFNLTSFIGATTIFFKKFKSPVKLRSYYSVNALKIFNENVLFLFRINHSSFLNSNQILRCAE